MNAPLGSKARPSQPGSHRTGLFPLRTGVNSILAIISKTAFRRYAFAVVVALGAGAVRAALDPALGNLQPFSTFYLSVLFTAWALAPGPAILVTVMGWLIGSYYFLPPGHALFTGGFQDVVVMVVYFGVCTGLILISHRMRRAHHVAELSERELRATLDQAAVGIFRVDSEDRITLANQRASALLGYSAEEFVGMTVHELTHPADRERSDRLNRHLHDGFSSRLEYEKRYLKRDGTPLWVHVTVSSVRDAEDRDVGSFGTFEDITRRKEAEALLRRSEEFKAAILDSLPAQVVVVDSRGVIVTANQPWQRFARENGSTSPHKVGPGANYLGVCQSAAAQGDSAAQAALEGIRSVLEGQQPRFSLEYPCHAPHAQRWFLMTVTRLSDTGAGATISHLDISDRRQAEQALQRQVRLFESVASTTPDFVYIFDREGRFIYANRRLLEVWGMTLEGAVGKTCRQLGYEQWHHDMHMREIAQVIETRQPIKGEVPFRAPLTGIFGIYEYIFTPVFGAGGEVELIAGTTRDVTDRKRSEEALRRSERRLSVFFESAMFGAIQWTMDGHITRVNDKFLQMLGFSREEFRVPLRWADLTPPEYHVADERALTELRACGVDTPYEKEFIRRDRTRITVLMGGATIDDERSEGLAFAVDITDRKRTEQALQRRSLHLQLLHQAAAGLLVGQQPVDLIRRLHKQIAATFGVEIFLLYEAEEGNSRLRLQAAAGIGDEERPRFEALRFGRAVCATRDEAMRPIIAMHIQAREARNRRFVRRLGFRSYLYYPLILNERLQGTLAFASRRRDEFDAMDLEFFHTVAGTLAQAFERQHLENQLHRHAANLEREVQERTARLRETLAELEGFSYSLIHDMRAPLRAMQSYATFIEEESSDRLAPEALDYLRKIRVASNRMDHLILDSLNYSKLLREELPLTPLNLASLLQSLVETYPNLNTSEADIQLDLGDIIVCGNEAALTQVFSNLLGNAVKFVTPGVRPRVRVWAEQREAGQVLIWIEDNGIGIPRHAQEKMFGMFERMHRADEYPGTGIGLAIVRKSVERIGGRVCVDSEPGKGSRFCVQLPLAPQANTGEISRAA